MATITLSFTGMVDGENTTVSSSGTIDDNYVSSFFDAYRNKFNPSGQSDYKNDADTFQDIATDLANIQAGFVKNYVFQKAVSQIEDQLPNISVMRIQ